MSLRRSALEYTKPEKEQFDFSNGCTLKAKSRHAICWAVKKDDILKLEFDGAMLAIGPLSWEA